MRPMTTADVEGFSLDDAALLRQFLSERDVPCPRCGYNLRNLGGNRCPECGDALALRVNLSEPRLGPLIAGLVSLSAGAGLNGLLLLYGLMVVAFQHRGSGLDSFFICNGVGFAVEGLALAAWLTRW